jgi:hypothetical protein
MKKFIAAIFLGGLFFSLNSPAADLKESKFTQVVNEVQVIASDKSIKPAAIDGLFDMPDVLRTGTASRAELVAADRTITRVGANTIFYFDQANRTVDLQQGSLLFHSDKGKGGGTIRTGAATASVLGTTLIVVTTPSGGFKVLLLEGHGEVHFANGKKQHLDAGQMTFVLPGGLPGPVFFFRLSDQVAHSLLVQGFNQPLSSLPLINNVIGTQNKLILSGQAVDTGLLVAGEPNPANPSTVPVVYIPDAPTVSAPPSPGDSGVTSPNSLISGIPNAISPLNEDFSSFQTVNLSAHTVILQNVQFAIGSKVTILTDTGILAPNPNTSASVVPGDLNFYNGVTVGGLPAQNFMTGTAGTAGIYSGKL